MKCFGVPHQIFINSVPFHKIIMMCIFSLWSEYYDVWGIFFTWLLPQSKLGLGAQIVFSSILLVGDWDPRRRWRDEVNDWLWGLCHAQGFRFYSLGHIFERLGTPEQMGRGCSGQHTGWASYQSFKLDSVAEGEILLTDGNEPGNIVTLGGNREICEWPPEVPSNLKHSVIAS